MTQSRLGIRPFDQKKLAATGKTAQCTDFFLLGNQCRRTGDQKVHIVVTGELQNPRQGNGHQHSGQQQAGFALAVLLPPVEKVLRKGNGLLRIAPPRSLQKPGQQQENGKAGTDQASQGKKGDLRKCRERRQHQCAIAHKTGRQRHQKTGGDPPQAGHRLPVCARTKMRSKILNGIVDSFAGEAGTKNQGNEVQFAKDGKRHHHGRQDAETNRQQAQKQWSGRTEDKIEQQQHADK